MSSLPPRLTSKSDYLYLKSTFPSSVWRPYWESLLSTAYSWQESHELGPDDLGVTDRTHKVQLVKDLFHPDRSFRKVQLYYGENPDGELFRLGFTISEVEDALL